MKNSIITSSIVTAVLLFSGCGSSDSSSDTTTVTPVVATVASIVFGNSGATDYTITSSSNSAVAEVNATDPALYLTIGKRYKFSVTNFGSHPLSLNNSAGTALLSMGTVGTFEADTDVNYSYDNNGSMMFTLTASLAESLNTYRCINHAAMTGSIVSAVDATVVLGNSGSTDYTITSTTNTAIAAVNANDPTLNLTVGKRYKFTVTNFGVHPMLLNDASGSTLLGMGSANGSLESDADVNFVDDGAGSITFTLTQALANSLSVYRCSPHAAMTGDIATN